MNKAGDKVKITCELEVVLDHDCDSQQIETQAELLLMAAKYESKRHPSEESVFTIQDFKFHI